MSKPTGLSDFGYVCGDSHQPQRQKVSCGGDRSDFQDGFFSQVACPGLPAVTSTNLGASPNHRGVPEAAFMKAWKIAMVDGIPTVSSGGSRIGRSRSSKAFSTDDTAIRNNRSRHPLEAHRQRSRSLQPRRGGYHHPTSTRHSSPSHDNARDNRGSKTNLVNHLDDFILPQYIGNQYVSSRQSSSSGNKSQNPNLMTDEVQSMSTSGNVWLYHIRCLPHGIIWTLLVILLSWGGLGLSVLTRQSLNFVSLVDPWQVSSVYDDISSLGIINARICYNETISTIMDPSKVGCFSVPLATNDDIDDAIFKVAAAFASVSVFLGFLLTMSITTSVCWRTINFKAIGTCYLFLYCFQSLSFLFFDTDVCAIHQCKVDIGCIYCIAASVFWISTCLLCAKMDSNRIRKELAEERKRRKKRAAKEAVKRRSIVNRSAGTVTTERTLSTVSDELTLFDMDEEVAVRTETPKRHSTTGIARQHESIITLDPCRRHSTGYTTVSALTPNTADNTLNDRNRGRLEYQGKPLSNRGRSRSKSNNPRGREAPRSKSRGRSQSAAARKRSTSRPKQVTSNSQYVRTAARPLEAPQPKTNNPTSKIRTVGTPNLLHASNTRLTTIALTPSKRVSSRQEEVGYVTSYFDI